MGRAWAAGAEAAARRVPVARSDAAHVLHALQRRAGNRAVASIAAPRLAGAHPAAVVQRLAAQVTADAATGEVTSLRIVGRPESAHSGTMGDHSTAFAVHAVSVIDRVQGRTVPAAVGELDALVHAMAALPGARLITNDPELQVRWEAEWQKLRAVRGAIAPRLDRPDLPELPILLQQYVAAYLEARELVPLTTVNVKAVAPALAGKGKGEARHAKALRGAGRGGPDAAVAKAAVLGLFDAKAVGLVAARWTGVEELVPGLAGTTTPDQRIELFVDQHLASLVAAYPTLWEVPDLSAATVKGDLTAAAKEAAKQAAADELAVQAQALEGARRKLKTAQGAAAGGRLLVKDLATIAEEEANVADVQLAYAAAAKKAEDLGAPAQPVVVAPPQVERQERSADGRDDEDALDDGEEDDGSTDEELDVEGSDEELDGAASDVEVDPAASGGGGAAADDGEEPETTPTMAAQLVVDGEGRIADVEFAGRPASPFAGTMGAHTTAWIVHLDVVRKAVRGKTVPEAVAATGTLAQEARALGVRRSAQLGALRGPRAKAFAKAETSLGNAATAAATPGPNQGLALQAYLVRLLSYENLIPGATVEAANTDGRGEGTRRALLLQHDRGAVVSTTALKEAVDGLLDLKAVDRRHHASLRQDHRGAIGKAYPRAFAAVHGKRGAELPLPDAKRFRPLGRVEEPEPMEVQPATTGRRILKPKRRAANPTVGWTPDLTVFSTPTAAPPQPIPSTDDIGMDVVTTGS